jgi:hypothetical protein
MNRITMLGLELLIGLAVMAAPLIASAQCIEVTPESWDYGDVKVGNSESQIVTIHSCASSAVTVYYIGIVEGALEAFTVGPVPDVPFPLPGGETLEVEVTFTPPELGVHEAFLYIVHDAPGSEIEIDLVGVGVKGWRIFRRQAAP